MGAESAGPVAAGRARGELPRWLAVVLVVVPCLLTFPVAGLGMMFGVYLSWSACADICGNYRGWFNSPAGAETILVAELFLGIAALMILACLVALGRRRVLGLAGWVGFLLACAGVGLLAWSP
jgi:hypothetical protein